MTQIDELVIRVPGFGNEESSHTLGKEVAQHVMEALPEEMSDRRIPELNIRMTTPAERGTTAMANAIAEQIIREIKLLNL
jgi:hypothetical protein